MPTQGYKTSPRKLEQIGYYTLTGNILGKGNFARVEEARHSILNVKVAIKMIDTSKIKDEAYVTKNLEREARILCSLAHPSIMYLYEAFQHGPMYYLVGEVALGGNLCTFLKRQRAGRLEERLTRLFARQLVSALAYMHTRGFIHRDLKMENVMLDSKWRQVKIVDFGLSSAWTAGQLLTTHCGSPEYAAPELFDAESSYGCEVDLWSLGVVLYGMAAGCLPFALPKSGGFVTSSCDRRIRLLTQVNKGYQATHDNILAHMSVDFRHMISQLLTVSVGERITVHELCFHPWVTSRQKHMMANYSYRQLNPEEHRKIIGHISKLLTMEREVVTYDVKLNRLGQIGGMFNLLVHKKYVELFKIDAANSEESKSQGKLKAKPVIFSDEPKQSFTRMAKRSKETNVKNFIGHKLESVASSRQIPNFQKPTYSSSKAATLTYASVKPIPPKSKSLISSKPLTNSTQTETNRVAGTLVANGESEFSNDNATVGLSKSSHKRQYYAPVPETQQLTSPLNKTTHVADIHRPACPLSGTSCHSNNVNIAKACVDKKILSSMKSDSPKRAARLKQMDLVNRLSLPCQKAGPSCNGFTKPERTNTGNQNAISRKDSSKAMHLPSQSIPVTHVDLCYYEKPLTAQTLRPRRQISSSCRRHAGNHGGYLHLGSAKSHGFLRDEQVPPFVTPVKQNNAYFHNWDSTRTSPDQLISNPPKIKSSCKHNTLSEIQRYWEKKVAHANKKLLEMDTAALEMQKARPTSSGEHVNRKSVLKIGNGKGKNRVSWTDGRSSADNASSRHTGNNNYSCDGLTNMSECQTRQFEDANRAVSKNIPVEKINVQQSNYLQNVTRKEQGNATEHGGTRLQGDEPTSWEERRCENHFASYQRSYHSRPPSITGRGDHLSESEEYILWSRL